MAPTLRPLALWLLLALSACKSGPEGTYILDRQATEELIRSEAPSISFGTADLTLDLKQRESGTWTATEGKVDLKTSESRLTCKSDEFVEPITEGKGSRVVLGIKGTVKR